MMQQYHAERLPASAEFSMEHILKPDYDFGSEFEFGLDVILDGLSRSIPEDGDSRRPVVP